MSSCKRERIARSSMKRRPPPLALVVTDGGQGQIGKLAAGQQLTVDPESEDIFIIVAEGTIGTIVDRQRLTRVVDLIVYVAVIAGVGVDFVVAVVM